MSKYLDFVRKDLEAKLAVLWPVKLPKPKITYRELNHQYIVTYIEWPIARAHRFTRIDYCQNFPVYHGIHRLNSVATQAKRIMKNEAK